MLVRRLFRIIMQLGVGLIFSLAVNADNGETAAGRVHLPKLPTAKMDFSTEQKCVAPTDVMRRLHGTFLKHKRNETMHQGIRTPAYSLVECISCHVTPKEDGSYTKIQEDPQHFCRSCHAYTAVQPDCFQCHASTPEKEAVSTDSVPANVEEMSMSMSE